MISRPALFVIVLLCVAVVVLVLREERYARRISRLSSLLSVSRSQLSTALGQPGAQPQENFMSTNSLDVAIAKLTADVAAEKTVAESAVALIAGLKTQLAAAIASAAAAGATDAQLAELNALSASIEAQTTDLTAAVGANTAVPVPAVDPQAI